MQLLSVWCNESIQDIRAALGPFVPSPSRAAPQFGYLRATYYDEHGANKIKLMKGELPWRTGHVQDFLVTVTLNPKPLNLNPKPETLSLSCSDLWMMNILHEREATPEC